MDAAPAPVPPPLPPSEPASPGTSPPPSLPEPSRPESRLASWLRLILSLLLVTGLMAGVFLLGSHLRQRLRKGGSHEISFTDIECIPPAGMSRQEFLEEAQYLADFPDRLDLLEAGIGARIAQTLAVHPWVASVRRVEVLPTGRVRVDLEHRLAVLLLEQPSRVVDGLGVLLPPDAPADGLPVLTDAIATPVGSTGRRWPDAAVLAAAPVVARVRLHLKEWGLAGCVVKVVDGDVSLRSPRRRVLWGRPPGKEIKGEAIASVKLQRLQQAPPRDGEECDVRPHEGMKRRALAAMVAVADAPPCQRLTRPVPQARSSATR